MGKATAVLIVGLVALMFVAAGTLQSLLILQRVAAVSDVEGDVKIQSGRGGAFYPLGQARYVRAGDVIRTEGGTVTLNWVDGTRVKVGAHTTLKVLKCQLNTATDTAVSVFRLDLGEVWVRVRKLLNPRSKFEVITPTCTAGVRGTLFAVSVRPSGETDVKVFEGEVKVTKGRQAVVVGSSRQARATQSDLRLEGLSPSDYASPSVIRSVENPFLQITAPVGDAAPVEDGAIVIRGVVEKGARVVVDGQVAHPGPNGRFEVAIPAAVGEKVCFTVVAEDDQGRRTTVTRTVRACPPLPTPAQGASSYLGGVRSISATG